MSSLGKPGPCPCSRSAVLWMVALEAPSWAMPLMPSHFWDTSELDCCQGSAHASKEDIARMLCCTLQRAISSERFLDKPHTDYRATQ